jgi:hypothetical protein
LSSPILSGKITFKSLNSNRAENRTKKKRKNEILKSLKFSQCLFQVSRVQLDRCDMFSALWLPWSSLINGPVLLGRVGILSIGRQPSLSILFIIVVLLFHDFLLAL